MYLEDVHVQFTHLYFSFNFDMFDAYLSLNGLFSFPVYDFQSDLTYIVSSS